MAVAADGMNMPAEYQRLEAQRLRDDLARAFHLDSDQSSFNLDFYVSAVTQQNPFYSTAEVLDWLRGLNDTEYFSVTEKPLGDLDKWSFNSETGDLEHESGGFFSIRGLKVRTNRGNVQEWSQPIIDQPEIGLLGIIVKKIDGVLYFLMQAKAEPGNINTFQLSPTVQATRSNFMRLHGGKATQYIEYFFETGKSQKLIDQLQSEQGARFYRKRNRNTIVQVADDCDIETGPLYRWLTLGQIYELLAHDNTMNMDARSVISCISFDIPRDPEKPRVARSKLLEILEDSPLVSNEIDPVGIDVMISAQGSYRDLANQSYEEIIFGLTDLKFKTILRADLIPLKDVQGWRVEADAIYREDERYFSVIGVGIQANSREVRKWDQPIVRQSAPGLVGFVTAYINDVLHFLVQAKLECGNMDILELAPTVQCITDNYSIDKLPPYANYLLQQAPKEARPIVDVMQSEEGGRFYHETNRNIVVVGPSCLPEQFEDSFYTWMTVYQLKQFIRYNNYLNVEARSLLSGLQMV